MHPLSYGYKRASLDVKPSHISAIGRTSDNSLRDEESRNTLNDTIARMVVREKTFITQINEERQEGDIENNVVVKAYDDDSDSECDSPRGKQTSNRKYAPLDDDGDEEINFDFDEENEEEIRKRTRRRITDTATIYQLACEKYCQHPCHSYQSQISHADVSLENHQLRQREVKPIAISLVKDQRIVILDLSHNDIGPMGTMYIAEMLQENSTIIDLNLSATNPGKAGIQALSETLRHNKSLRTLYLEENRIEHTDAPILAEIIKKTPKLRGLYLGHNRLGFYGGKDIAEALSSNSSLQTLDLQWNHLRRESAVQIARALATNKGLRTLNVAWNGFGKEGCLALALSLIKNTTLQELDLSCNRIDFLSLGFLIKGMARNKGLQSIKLGFNPMTTEGTKEIVKALAASKVSVLRELDLQDVPVDREFIQMVKDMQMDRDLNVEHGHEMKLGTNVESKEHDGSDLNRYDPVLVLFEYMKMDNLRLIDMFHSFDTRHRDKLSREDFREGVNTLRIPLTEHALDLIMEKLDVKKDGVVDLEEMMKVHREVSRQVNQRQLRAKAKKKEDQGLISLRKILKGIIQKRKDEQDKRKEELELRRESIISGVGVRRESIISGEGVRRDSIVATSSGGRRESLIAPPGGTRRGSLIAPPGGARRGSLIAPPGGARRGSLIAPPGGARRGSLIASSGGGRRQSLVATSGEGRRQNVIPTSGGGNSDDSGVVKLASLHEIEPKFSPTNNRQKRISVDNSSPS